MSETKKQPEPKPQQQPTAKALRDSVEQPTQWGGQLDPRLARL